MSLEAALEEERLEILKLLERPQRRSPAISGGSMSTPGSPRQAYASLARTTSPQRPVSSLIDAVAGPPRRSATPINSGRSSPVDFGSPSNGGLYRTRSDSNGGPRILGRNSVPSAQPHDAYDFSMIPSVSGSGVKKRTSSQPSSMLEAAIGFPQRSKSPLGQHAYHHQNPHSRTSSPHTLRTRMASPAPSETHRIRTESGSVIDLDYAYAKLNDQALAASGGALAKLPERRPLTDKQGDSVRAGTGESLTQDGGVRLQKDIEESALVDSSDPDTSDEDNSYSDEEEDRGRPGSRGRVTSSLVDIAGEAPSRGNSSEREAVGVDTGGEKKKKKSKKSSKGTAAAPKKKISSLLAAAEEERKQVSSSSSSSKYSVRSLLPQISVTSTNQAGASSPTMLRRSGVHPSTNFDLPSQTNTPNTSDQEADDLDIRRAQRMETAISPILSSPESHRVVRTILRGDYETVLKQSRRTRKYLVATDLSSEAQYAMEWTIGTVLRDGDTLLAICAVDHDTIEDGSKPVSESSIGEAISEVTDQSQAAVNGILGATGIPPHVNAPGTSSPLKEALPERSRERTKAERERYVAAEAITTLITKLLKKTRLQVKVIVEVIHCKSPKHLLTEIIDLIEPTLVVLGSRGRSALKGVLLGSFSNYLVAKSSVPVMVARKKLKHTKKYSQTNIRLSNNLTSNTQRILANAKVD